MVALAEKSFSYIDKEFKRTKDNFDYYMQNTLRTYGVEHALTSMISTSIERKGGSCYCRVDASVLALILKEPEKSLFSLNYYLQTGTPDKVSEYVLQKAGKRNLQIFAEWLEQEIQDGKNFAEKRDGQFKAIEDVINQVNKLFGGVKSGDNMSLEFTFESKSKSRPNHGETQTR